MSGNDLAEKLALVTGAGSGIGRAVAQLFSSHGAKVIVADIKDGAETLALIGGEDAGHLSVETDVSKAESVNNLAEKILEHYKTPPSVVVHCAGVIRNLNGLDGSTEDILDQVININLKGTYLVNRKFALLMKEHKIPGSIVNMSSMAARGCSFGPEYATSKAGQIGWTLSLAKELAPYGIRCNTVHPGRIDTPIVDSFPEEQRNNPNVRLNARLGRVGEAKEVAEVCLFLASDRSSYVTQSCYDVDGGCKENE